MATTVEEKRDLVKRFLSEQQYRYADDIVEYLDRLETNDRFIRRWYTSSVKIPKEVLYSDPCVSPLDALSDLIQKYKEQGYTDVPNISWDGIYLTGHFIETEEQFYERIKENVHTWVSVNIRPKEEIQRKISNLEKELEHLRQFLDDDDINQLR